MGLFFSSPAIGNGSSSGRSSSVTTVNHTKNKFNSNQRKNGNNSKNKSNPNQPNQRKNQNNPKKSSLYSTFSSGLSTGFTKAKGMFGKKSSSETSVTNPNQPPPTNPNQLPPPTNPNVKKSNVITTSTPTQGKTTNVQSPIVTTTSTPTQGKTTSVPSTPEPGTVVIETIPITNTKSVTQKGGNKKVTQKNVNKKVIK